MTTREDVHRLIDTVSDDRLAVIEEILRASVETGMTSDQVHQLAELLRGRPAPGQMAAQPVRRFASAGTLSAEPDLAERAEQVLRSEPGTAA